LKSIKSLIKFVLKSLGIYQVVINQMDKINLKKKFKRTYYQFSLLEKNSTKRFELSENNLMPCYWDASVTTGFDRHYVFHTAWAARAVQKIAPKFHVDISSSLFFSTIVSAFVPIKFYDYRPADISIPGFESFRGDLMNLPFEDKSIKSLSCLHTIEHIGLGRYGDPLDYDGDLKAIKELIRVLAENGDLLIVVPTGKSKIHYNAHRIYSYAQIINYFKELKLIEFSLLRDDENDASWINNASEDIADKQNYGCGCFWFRREKLN
jgi:SAM-dependent methyltransferase